MKKIIILYFICIVVLFFVPVLFVKKAFVEKNNENINVSKTNSIRLLLSETKEVKVIDLEEYLMGVLIGEMPVSYELEALKAQAVVARTYTLNKLINLSSAHENADMCDDINHCQAYKTKEYALASWDDNVENEKWNKIKKAVTETTGEIITYNGALINAFFHADSGGKTEDILNIWGHEDIPYLKSVDSIEPPFLDKVSLTYDEINKIMIEKYQDFDETLQDIEIIERNSTGRVSKIKISNIVLEGTEIRSLFNLRSTDFEVKVDETNVVFETKGYGHGIGMSQNGANYMAMQGKTYEEIIKHYYTNVNLEKLK